MEYHTAYDPLFFDVLELMSLNVWVISWHFFIDLADFFLRRNSIYFKTIFDIKMI
jgi:hypothetical protein